MPGLQSTMVGHRHVIHHLSQSQLGKSTTLEILSGAFLPSVTAYCSHHQRLSATSAVAESDGACSPQRKLKKGAADDEPSTADHPDSPQSDESTSDDGATAHLYKPRPLHETEAYRTWRDLQPTVVPEAAGRSSSPSAVATSVTEYFTPDFYFKDEMAEEEEEIKAALESLHQYKLHSTDFMPADILLPPAGNGTTGNIQSVYICHGQEFQVLAMFQSKRWASDELIKYLRYMSNPRTYRKADMDRQEKLKETWNLLTGGLSVDDYLDAYKSAIKNKQPFDPPLLPWLSKLLDYEFIFRSRSRGHAPNLLRELMATRLVLKLLLRPSSLKSVAELSKLLQHFEQHYAWAPGFGPWSELFKLVKELEGNDIDSTNVGEQLKPLDALSYCIKELRVWLPNSWYQLSGITMIDAVGCNDISTLRQAQLRFDEARSDTNMIMLDRDTDAAVFTALLDSPFLEKWVAGQLDPAAPHRPVLAIMMYMEEIGVPPPDRQRDIRSPIVTVKYIMKHPNHIARKAEANVSAIRNQFSMMIERYLLDKKLVSEATTPSAKETKQQRVQQLTNAVPIFCCLPLLGLTLLHNKEQLLAQHQYTAEQWTAAVQATRVYDWAAAQLLQPVANIRSSLAAEIAAELQQQDLIDKDMTLLKDSLLKLKKLARGANISLKHGTKQAVLLNTRFGSGTPFSTHFNAAFVQIRSTSYKTYFETLVQTLSAAFGQQVLQHIMSAFDSFLQPEKKDAGSKLEKLFNVLHPSYRWHHRKLPLATIISGAVTRALQRNISAVEEQMLAPLKAQMIDALWMIFHQELSEYVCLRGEKQGAALTAADVEQLVKLAYSEELFREQAAEQFRLAFTPGQHHRRLAVYARSLSKAWDTLLSTKLGSQTIYQSLYDRLTSKYNEVSTGSYEAICAEVRGVLRQSVSQILQRLNLKLRENLDAALLAGYNNFTDRVYLKASYQPSAPRYRKVFIIKAIKDATYQLAQLALDKPGKASGMNALDLSGSQLNSKPVMKQEQENPWVQLQAMRSESHELLKAKIQLLEDPQKIFKQLLGELGGSLMTSNVDPALQLLFCEGYKIAQHHLQLTAAASTPDASNELGQMLAGAGLMEPLRQLQQQPQGPSLEATAMKHVTGQRMQEMLSALTAQGKQLKDVCTSSDDSCLYALLSSVFGLDPSGTEPYSQQVVANYRQQTAELLLSETRKTPSGPWASALAAQLGFSAPNAAGAAEAVQLHLKKLMAGAPFNVVHLAALVQLLSDTLNVQVTVYSPTTSRADGFMRVLAANAAGQAVGMSVSIANVWHEWVRGNPAALLPEAQGVLDHWVLVTDSIDLSDSDSRQHHTGSSAASEAALLLLAEAAAAGDAPASASASGLKRGAEGIKAVTADNSGVKKQRMGPLV